MTIPRRQTTITRHKIVRVVSILIVLAPLTTGFMPLSDGVDALAADLAAGDLAVVDTDYLNLRAGSGLSSEVVTVLPDGTKVRVTAGPETEDGHDWYEVHTSDDQSGWVAGTYLSLVNSWARFAIGDLADVDTLWLNLRTGPGLSEEVIFAMSLDTRVTILEGPTANNGYHWYKLRTGESVVGWSVDEFLVPADSESVTFAKGEQLVVNTNLLNLRLGAGLSQEILAVLPGGTVLIVSNGPIAMDGYDWYEVETRDGRLGWVAGAYAVAERGIAVGFAIGDAVRVANGAQNLREGPGLDAAIRRVLADDEILVVRDGPVEANGYTWYLIWNYGGEGWAAGEFLHYEPDGLPPEGGA